MAYKPKAPAVVSEINVIPMADIMLVLLIIFMVVTPMLQKGMSVDLVPVENPREMPDADRDDAIIVAITRDGSIYLDVDKIRQDEILPRVRDLISTKLDKTVYVKSDQRARYGNVVAVVDEVRAAGVDKVGLLTEKSRTTRPGATSAPAPSQN
jgi:biopolymer transport protein ExbD/biopolymer transport protein TolR